MWSEKHLHQLAYQPTTVYCDSVKSAVKKMAMAMAALRVAKIVVKVRSRRRGCCTGC